MKKFFTLFVAMMVTCALWASNVITYTASAQLPETTSSSSSGLHTNAFNVAVISHTFSNGAGTITFAGEMTSIGDYAFYKCSGLTSVTIPNSVTSIGSSAFTYCTGLTSITIPNSVTSIGNRAFRGCSGLTSVTIPNSVTSIGNRAFEGCSGLTSVTIPNSVTSIGEWAFAYCTELTSVTIPNSVTSIGEGAFYGCSGLKTVYNLSNLDIVKGATTHGYVAYYADNVYTGYYVFVTSSDLRTGITSITLDGKTIPNDTILGPGTEITIAATPATGYHFVRWNDGDTINPRSLVLTQNTAFVAEFEINSYAVSTTSSNSTMGMTYGDTTALYQDSVTIWATPATGYQFNGWSDGNTDNPRTITLTEDINLVANFGPKMCTLTIISNMEEAADITGAGTYAYGTTITCSIDALSGYNFVKWGDGKTYNPYKFKIYDDMTLYAFFEEEGGAPVAPDSMVITPNEDNANLQWPQVDNAQTYTMTITKRGETICTLTFNGLGQLVNIDFTAPARGAASAAPGFNFTVTGLESGTTYGYTILAKDEKGNVLSTETGTFTTTCPITALDAVYTPMKAKKVLRDGQVLILRDNHIYSAQGLLMK